MYKKIVAIALAITVIAGGSLCMGKKAEAAKKYPSRPITMTVNYSAGGGTDLSARALADAMSKKLGVPITVTNRPGGTGTVGIAALQESKPDGYTFGLATSAPLTIVPHQLKVPYTPEDFKYIGVFAQYGYGVVVAKNSPYKTLDDLIAAAKKEPIKFGGTGYPQPFVGEELNKKTGSKFEFVSYPKTTDLVTDVLGGFIPFAVADMASFAAYVKSGDMRLLASAIDKRWEVAKDVPTLIEMGYETSLSAYLGLCAPKDTPDECVAVLREAVAEAIKDPKFKEVLKNCNQGEAYLTGPEYEKFVKEKYVEYGNIFKK